MLLTRISAEKPSAIFRVNNSASIQNLVDVDEMIDDDRVEQYDIKVGISIVPLATAQSELEALKAQQAQVQAQQTQSLVSQPASTAPTNPSDIAVLAGRIVQHAYNFLSGFTTPDGKVPMKAFDDWWNKFKTRLASDPKFLDSLDG